MFVRQKLYAYSINAVYNENKIISKPIQIVWKINLDMSIYLISK